MQVAKISTQIYSNNRQNLRTQNAKSNQQTPSFGLSFVPNELAPRFEKLVANVEGISLKGIIDESLLKGNNYTLDLASTMIKSLKSQGHENHTVFLNWFEKTSLEDFSLLLEIKKAPKTPNDWVETTFKNKKIWDNNSIETLEKQMEEIDPVNIGAQIKLLRNNGF